jgi:hypothetical protein
MYKFGERSKNNLATCHPLLQEILNEAIKHVDFSVLQGHRGEIEQNAYYSAGKSKVKWPNSKHNKNPSHAVDVAPYPIDWEDIKRFAHLMGLLRGIAVAKGIKVRIGADWDNDGDITDHKFMDWPHIELVMDD